MKTKQKLWKLDQGALGMSDPCGTLPLALKPNAVPRINCLLSNFYFCANWSVVPCQMIGLEGPVWGRGYMPRRRRLYANCQLPVELILYELRPNSPGGGYMPTTIRRRLYANWYSTNSDLTVPAEVICHFPLQLAYELRPKWSKIIAKMPFLDRGPTQTQPKCSNREGGFNSQRLFEQTLLPPGFLKGKTKKKFLENFP